jgi:hypothetical protein
MVASFAQSNVYSINVVGYVTLTITNDSVYRIISNPLITTNNNLSALIPTALPGAQVYKLLPGGAYSIATFDPDLGGWDPDFAVATGEGVFIKLSTPGSFPITFVGEVAQNAASNKQLPAGLSLQGSLVPQEGSVISVLQVPGNPGDQLYKLNLDGVYTIATYDPDLGGWDPEVSIGVAEGFFFSAGSVLDWNRNFVVP